MNHLVEDNHLDFLSYLGSYFLVAGLIKAIIYNSRSDLPNADGLSFGAYMTTVFGKFDVVSQ